MFVQNSLQSLLATVTRIGADEEDSDEIRLQKTLLTAIALMVLIAAFLWGGTYLAFDEPLAASIPLSYAIFSSVSIIIFSRTHRYKFFRFSQLSLILLLPFLLMVVLGGFINSSAVILWSLLTPLGALLFAGPRQSLYWFLTYVGLVVVSGFLQTLVRTNNNLSPTLITIFFVLNISAISSTVFVLLYYFVTQKDTMFGLLHIEQQKSERLLLNILPKEIAQILKVESGIIADHFENASVLFADLVGFTPMSAQMEPAEMVRLLNEIFSYFDSLVDKYGLEKIRTIGDNYMVASGVPRPHKDHARLLASFALEMLAYTKGFPAQNGNPIDFRIGINSGPLVAGIIGQRKFQYDVWGDTVNTASRMESHGVAGKIQITRATYELLQADFICAPQGKIRIKGKGEMEVWHLLSEKNGT